MKNYVKTYEGRDVPDGASHVSDISPNYPEIDFYRWGGVTRFRRV